MKGSDPMAFTLDGVKDEAIRLIGAAQISNINLRLIGGLAVKLRCPSASHRSLERKYADVDFVTDRAGSIRLSDFLVQMGYTPNKTFNTLSGDHRQLYYDLERERQVDIFIGDFSMCHKIPLQSRLSVDALTIPLAELFLTKAQIVEINQKDILDLYALLLDHEIGSQDGEFINGARIAELCARDWGLYTTVWITLERMEEKFGPSELTPEHRETIAKRLAALRAYMEEAPKTTAWKLRARIGRKVRWYDLPEEVQRK
jgi:hypothetical protein